MLQWGSSRSSSRAGIGLACAGISLACAGISPACAAQAGHRLQPSHSYVSCSEPSLIIIYDSCCGSTRKPRPRAGVTLLSPVRCRYPKKALAKAGGGGSGNVAASLPRSSSGTTRGRDLRLLRTRHQLPGDPHRTPSPLVPYVAVRSLLLDFPGPTRVFEDTEAEGSCDQNCLAESAVTSRTGRMGGRAKGKLVVPEPLRLLQLPGQSRPCSEGVVRTEAPVSWSPCALGSPRCFPVRQTSWRQQSVG